MKKLFTCAFAVLAAAAVMFFASPSEAVHRGSGTLACGSCHTMHNSQGGSAVVNTLAPGGLVLLRGSVSTRQDMAAFCLNCHAEDGGLGGTTFDLGITPPKVYRTSISWTDANGFNTIGGGGDFRWELDSTYAVRGGGPSIVGIGYGHSVGISSGAVTAPGGSVSISGFSCTTCHDPHGAPAWATDTWVNTGASINVFRNLKTNPDGAGGSVTLSGVSGWAGSASGWKSSVNWIGEGTSNARDHIWPDRSDAVTGSTDCTMTTCNTYYTSGNDGMSGWCAQCHPNWHEANVSANADGNDWRRHPVNLSLVDTAGSQTSGANITIFTQSHYTDNGINPTQGRLPAADVSASPAGKVYADSFTAGGGDRIFCLSCHFAHAGPYFDGLKWDHLSSVTVGAMTGNDLASNVGCQQCHNK